MNTPVSTYFLISIGGTIGQKITQIFFCPGYWPKKCYDDAKSVATVNGAKWYFSNRSLAGFLKELEKHTKWRYTGGCELLIVNARYRMEKWHQMESRMQASLDFKSAIAIDLEKASNDKAIKDASGLADAIFEFAEKLNESIDDPCWEFSDKQGLRIVKGSLKEFLVAYLPSWLKPEVKKALHFATADLSPGSA